jgi:hypothetical protein
MNKVYFSANVAKEKTNEILENIMNKKLSRIFSMYIVPSIDKGLYYANVPESEINDDIMSYLRDLNYDVEQTEVISNKEYLYLIKWQ